VSLFLLRRPGECLVRWNRAGTARDSALRSRFRYYFLPPIHSLGPKLDEIPRLVIFTVSALFVGSLSAAERSAIESLRRARDDLKKTVQELQHTNEALQAESDEASACGRGVAAERGLSGRSAEANAYGKLGLAGGGKRRLASLRGMVSHIWFDPKEGLPAWEKNGCSVFILRIEPSGRRQPIGQSVKSRITTWNFESFFPTGRSSTSTQSAIRFWKHPEICCNLW